MIKYIEKKAREKRGFSVRKLTELSTVAPSTIWKYEAEYNLPELMQLDLIAIILNVDITELIQFTPN